MARKQNQVSIAGSPQNADSFKLIKGIGPALSARLQDAGITSFRQLASLTPDEIALQVGGLSTKQIAQQNWAGQAGKLASKKVKSKSAKKEVVKRKPHQHYENFTLEFLLDEKRIIRRTRLVHIQSGDADTWAGWEVESFIDFLARHAGVRILTPKQTNQAYSEERNQIPHIQTVDAHSNADEIPPPLTLPVIEPPLLQTSKTPDMPVKQAPEIDRLTGTLCLRSLEVIPTNSDSPVSFIRQAQPYTIRLQLDLAEVIASGDPPLIFKTSILAKQLGGPSHAVGEILSTLKFSDTITLDIDGARLPPGAYRLESFVELRVDQSSMGLTANLKGGLLQVY